MRRTAVILTALALDLAAGDPPDAWHPVAWLGRLIGWMTGRAPKDGPNEQLAYGAAIVGVASQAAAGAFWLAEQRMPGMGPAGFLGFALEVALLKFTFSLRGLLDAGDRVRRDLERQDIDAARIDVRALVSRDTADLSPELLASAAVESLAENFTDSVIAPLLAYRLFGLPGAAVYRAVNTCDAMIGYHGRYEYLGKAAARLDDVLNFAPARLSALLLAAAAPLAGGSATGALRVLRRDRGLTESPNAGWTMSAAAGALGVQLEKPGHYRLGDPDRPLRPATIAQARSLVAGAVALGVGLSLAADLIRWSAARRERV